MNAILKESVEQASLVMPKRAVKRLPARPSKRPSKAATASSARAISKLPATVSKLERKAKHAVRESAKGALPDAPTPKPEKASGHVRESATKPMPDLAPIIDNLREMHRQRQDMHRAEKSLTLQIRAICRRLCAGDKGEADVLYKAMEGKGEHEQAMMADVLTTPFKQARAILEGNRKEIEKRMEKAAKTLPVWSWVESISGFGAGSLAAVIGETGDLSNYATHSKVWKRLGLAVIDGGRQRRVSGADALVHGYSPSRRSIVWNIGQCVFKAQSQRVDKETGEIKKEAGFYRKIYDARKELELTRVETKGHAHNRATRYMEKRLMRDLWKAWNSI